MKKLQPKTLVKVYEDTPTFPNGGVAMVIDNSTGEEEVEYLVKEINDFESDPDADQLPKPATHAGKWVRRKNLHVIEFNKPKKQSKLLATAKYLAAALVGASAFWAFWTVALKIELLAF